MPIGIAEIILVVAFILGIGLILSDGSLNTTNKFLWCLGVLVFNIFAVVTYLFYRFIFRKKANIQPKNETS